jgi:hypothetical protein
MKNLVGIIVIALIAYAIWRAVQSNKQENSELGTLQSLPPSVQQVVGRMDPQSRSVFFQEYKQKRKPLFVGYILWFIFALYYAYYRKIGLQIVFWITGGGLGIWWIIDLFRMPAIAREANEQIARNVLQTLNLGAAFTNPLQNAQEQQLEL